MNLRRVIAEVLADPADRAAFASDPSETLAQRGFDGLGAETAGDAVVHYASGAPLAEAEALTPAVRHLSAVWVDDAAVDGWTLLGDVVMPSDGPMAEALDEPGHEATEPWSSTLDAEGTITDDFGAGRDPTDLDEEWGSEPDDLEALAVGNGEGEAANHAHTEADIDALVQNHGTFDDETEPFSDYGLIQPEDPDELGLDE